MVKSAKKKKSSLELGIFKKLKEEEKFFEWIIAQYVVSVNSKFYSYDFPSSQLTKLVLKILNKPKTKFSITHKMVKEILKKWEKSEICKYLTSTKYSRCRGKTKDIYRFTDSGFKKIKEMIIDIVINSITNNDALLLKMSDQQTMKTRDRILEDFIFKCEEQIEALVSSGEIEDDNE
ncbi:MAG: hypothetical protein ACTSRG_05340 [Candidatus Helarchaeota archaeon]